MLRNDSWKNGRIELHQFWILFLFIDSRNLQNGGYRILVQW